MIEGRCIGEPLLQGLVPQGPRSGNGETRKEEAVHRGGFDFEGIEGVIINNGFDPGFDPDKDQICRSNNSSHMCHTVNVEFVDDGAPVLYSTRIMITVQCDPKGILLWELP